MSLTLKVLKIISQSVSLYLISSIYHNLELSYLINKLFINNQFVESESNDTMNVINPATEEIIDTITFATENEVNSAVEKSKQAQLEWEKVPQPTRADHVKMLSPLLEEYKDEIAK